MIGKAGRPDSVPTVSERIGKGGRRIAGRISRRPVLRAGYGALLALLVFSAVEAYYIQSTVSEKNIEIYRQYVRQDEAVSELRRAIWQGANHARDFFLSSNPDRLEIFRTQLQQLRVASAGLMGQLEGLSAPGRARELKTRVEEFWVTLEQVAAGKKEIDPSVAYQFVQREIVPRRSSAANALRELTVAGQEALQNNELEFVRSRRAAARRMFLILGASVIFGLFIALFSLKHAENLERESLRQYEEVAQAKRDLERLSARLLEIQEEERGRLARELHDEVGQTLTALRIEISHALAASREPQIRERLERARGLAERTVQTVRDISLLLRPAMLDDLGLAPALQWHLEHFSRRSGIQCEFTEEGLHDFLPESVKTCVYRVVQEALHNCEKHAAASRIRVSVRQTPEQLTVEIEDDGRGFALDSKGLPPGSGFGIAGMRERAAIVGGALAFESAPGLGTKLSLAIPLAGRGCELGVRA